MPNIKQSRVLLKDLVASQLPEFVRSQYPTFVAFVEAYYEFLDSKNIDLAKLRDIDDTLDEFIKYFKLELSHNYPISSSYDTERFLLKHVKEQYLAKGSEASYKLLFRLLFGKEVYMEYPGKQMLRVSDGRWQQDMSIFVRVGAGDPNTLIGKIVYIQSSKIVYAENPIKGYTPPAGADLTKISANVESVKFVGGDVYELFLNKGFYGEIYPGDSVRYGSEFQGVILPCTAKVKIQNRGVGFSPGQVFQVSSGGGSPIWFKVLDTENIVDDAGNTLVKGALKNIELIKFGLNYATDFTLTILPSSSVSNVKAAASSASSSNTVTYSATLRTIVGATIIDGGYYTMTPTVSINGVTGDGATAHAILDANGAVVEIVIDSNGSNYDRASMVCIPNPLDVDAIEATIEPVLGSFYKYNYIDTTNGFTESGYLIGGDKFGDYWDLTYHGKSASVGLNFKPASYLIKTSGTGYSVDDIVEIPLVNFGHVIQYKVLEVDVSGKVLSLSVETDHVFSSLPTDFVESGILVTSASSGSGLKIIPLFTIDHVDVLSGGVGYDLNYPVLDIEPPEYIDGMSTLHTNPGKFKLNIANGSVVSTTPYQSVKSAVVLTGGSGYTKSPKIHFVRNTLSDYSNAFGTGVVVDGSLDSIEILSPGNGYTQTPTIVVGDSWVANNVTYITDQLFYGDRLYTCLDDGILGNVAPTHESVQIPATEIVSDRFYRIVSLGNTDWNQIAGTEGIIYQVGMEFTSDAQGSGTGVVAYETVLSGQVRLKYVGTKATAEVSSMYTGGIGYSRQPSFKLTGAGGYADGSYVGVIKRQFFIDAKDTSSPDGALLNVSLGAIARYPGYYKTNDGFLDDSMFVQDSSYYQSFAYVLKIDEQLEKYSSVVRAMLHPSGMAMFGEYSINKNIALTVGLTSLVKSLGVTLYDVAYPDATLENDLTGKTIRGLSFLLVKDLLSVQPASHFTPSFDVEMKVPGEYQGFDDDDATPLEQITNIHSFLMAPGSTRGADDDNVYPEMDNRIVKLDMVFPGDASLSRNDHDNVTPITSRSLMAWDVEMTVPGGYQGFNDDDTAPDDSVYALSVYLNTLQSNTNNYPQLGWLVKNSYDKAGYFEEHYANVRSSDITI